MPRGLKRLHHSGDFHFITFSCYHRLPYLGSAISRDLFEDALEKIRLRFHFVVAGYVVMPEHAHLLISEPMERTVADAMRSLKLSVTLRSKERPFWQARSYDFNLHNGEKRIEKLKYMHRNPVVRGLVNKPEEWKWSSFRHYSTGVIGVVEIESEWTAFRRGSQLPEFLRYKKRTD
jgi:putative transposase